MPMLLRTGQILVNEGIGGLSKRFFRKLRGCGQYQSCKKDYSQCVENFNARSRELGHGDLSHYYWYHTIDLGNGLVTPGDYDYRPSLPAFHFPDDMTGMDVLDVGAATGFFSFEFEKRGASVVAVDLPSVAEWDIIAPDKEKVLGNLADFHKGHSIDDSKNDPHLNGPFEFCSRVLKSRVEKVNSRVYDLSPKRLGRQFDIVFMGDILPHLFSPLAALNAVAPLCKKLLVVSLDLWPSLTQEPGLVYVGDSSTDNRPWWRPNMPCLVQMLKTVGFRSIKVVGRNQGVVRRNWLYIDRPVIHATK